MSSKSEKARLARPRHGAASAPIAVDLPTGSHPRVHFDFPADTYAGYRAAGAEHDAIRRLWRRASEHERSFRGAQHVVAGLERFEDWFFRLIFVAGFVLFLVAYSTPPPSERTWDLWPLL